MILDQIKAIHRELDRMGAVNLVFFLTDARTIVRYAGNLVDIAPNHDGSGFFVRINNQFITATATPETIAQIVRTQEDVDEEDF